MIERYTRPQMKAIWDLKHKYEIWLEVELQACAAFERAKQAPRGTAAKIRKKAKIDVERIAEIETVTKHDVIAFLESLMDTVGPEHRFLHMGLTSSDIVDTSLAIQMTEALDLILEGVEEFLAVLKKQSLRYRNHVMVGRSHGIHGEPITFGLKL
ncbi:MAG TPA: lyase family protein, partial [Nitrospira sp.]